MEETARGKKSKDWEKKNEEKRRIRNEEDEVRVVYWMRIGTKEQDAPKGEKNDQRNMKE